MLPSNDPPRLRFVHVLARASLESDGHPIVCADASPLAYKITYLGKLFSDDASNNCLETPLAHLLMGRRCTDPAGEPIAKKARIDAFRAETDRVERNSNASAQMLSRVLDYRSSFVDFTPEDAPPLDTRYHVELCAMYGIAVTWTELEKILDTPRLQPGTVRNLWDISSWGALGLNLADLSTPPSSLDAFESTETPPRATGRMWCISASRWRGTAYYPAETSLRLQPNQLVPPRQTYEALGRLLTANGLSRRRVMVIWTTRIVSPP